ncbi:MAG TPA: VWA domain-containing protein [Pyrinomonadaceae bacterium]|nr:VWA domain-containing protein [Pyrinomonadaceae bacterium]
METRRTSSLAILLIAAQFCIYFNSTTLAHARVVSDNIYEKTFSQKFAAIEIENANGRTEVETWNSNRIRVSASRNTTGDGRPISARINFQVSDTDLKIQIREDRNEPPINLLVFVPREINLAVRGDSETIAIRGITKALSVQTESGDISLSLPKSANTDLSLRSLDGTINSQLDVHAFGPINSHSLDGRTGRGGTPIIIRSTRGSVSLIADEAGRIARADATMANGAGRSDPPLLNASSFSSQNEGNRSSAGPNPPTMIDPNDPPVADVIKIDSRLVNLNVRVTDSAGKLIPNLSQADFQIFENNIEQQVVRFEPVTSPVSVVLLLDASGSTKEHWKIIKKAAKKFIETLSPNTPIAVAMFTRKFMVICDFSCDRKTLKERIDKTKNRSSGTAFYDATWSTLDLFKEVKEQRKAVVMMTDGVDNSLSDEDYEPKHPFDEVFARISEDEITIYPIYFDTEYQVTVRMGGSDTHESYVTAREQLKRIADETGGTLFKADRAEDLDGVYQRVASELQTLYSVSYNPADKNYDGNWRNVGVKVKQGAAMARTKRGFYAR